MTLTVTVLGGFWETFANGQMVLYNQNPIKRRIARLLDTEAMKGYRELMLTLNGTATGSAASETHKRILAREDAAGTLGGLRTIETVTDVSATTASADKLDIDANILAFPDAPTYATNLDGNPRNVPGGVNA